MSDAMQDGERAQRDSFRPSQVKVENNTPMPPLPVEALPLKGIPGIHSRITVLENTIASANLSISDLSGFLTYSKGDDDTTPGKCTTTHRSSVQYIISRINSAIDHVERLHAKINICKSEIMGE